MLQCLAQPLSALNPLETWAQSSLRVCMWLCSSFHRSTGRSAGGLVPWFPLIICYIPQTAHSNVCNEQQTGPWLPSQSDWSLAAVPVTGDGRCIGV